MYQSLGKAAVGEVKVSTNPLVLTAIGELKKSASVYIQLLVK
jgi:hypothetical protein